MSMTQDISIHPNISVCDHDYDVGNGVSPNLIHLDLQKKERGMWKQVKYLVLRNYVSCLIFIHNSVADRVVI